MRPRSRAASRRRRTSASARRTNARSSCGSPRRRPYLLGPARAATDVSGAPAVVRGERRRVRATGQAAVERRVRARGLGDRFARRCATQRPLLERRGDAARARALRPHRRRGHGVAPVPGRPARLHVCRAAAAIPVDQAAPCRGAAHRTAAQRLLLRLQPDAAAVQGPARACAARCRSSIDRDRLVRLGDGRRRGAGVRLGAARRLELHAATVRLRDEALRRSASRKRSGSTRQAGLFGSAPAPRSNFATARATRTTGSPWRWPRCGRMRSASRPASMPRSFARCCRASRRARTRRCSARAGSPTSTTPTRSRSC